MSQADMMKDACRYVRGELSKKMSRRAWEPEKALNLFDLDEAFADLEHALNTLEEGKYTVNSQGELELKS